jgi:hypothetical protein
MYIYDRPKGQSLYLYRHASQVAAIIMHAGSAVNPLTAGLSEYSVRHILQALTFLVCPFTAMIGAFHSQ